MLVTLALFQLVATNPDDPAAQANRITPEVLAVQAAGPAVVYVRTNERTNTPFFFGPRIREGSGSGVVIYEEGYIVTNYHVVKNADAIEVQFNPLYDSNVYPAELIQAAPAEDLALLKIVGEDPFPTVAIGSSDDLMIAERVLAIGNPYGQTHTVSAGIISGLHRDVQTTDVQFRNLIQTDASINPGNSGGALLNINGELIGINTAMNTVAENIGFAIPVDHVKDVLWEYLLDPTLAKAWLGFQVDSASLAVNDIVPGSPAQLAGLQLGDRLEAIGDRPVDNEESYRLARVNLEPWRPTPLRVKRAGRSHDLVVESWERDRGLLYERAGLTVESIALGRRAPIHTVRVDGIRPGGAAERLGLQKGDVINYVQTRGHARARRVTNVQDFAVHIAHLNPGHPLDIEIWRDENANGRLERSDDYSELFTGALVLE